MTRSPDRNWSASIQLANPDGWPLLRLRLASIATSTSAYRCFGSASGVVRYLRPVGIATSTICHGPGPRKRSRGTRANASTSAFDLSRAAARSRSAYARRTWSRSVSVGGTAGAACTKQQGVDQNPLAVCRDVERVIRRIRHRRVEEFPDAVHLELVAVALHLGCHQRRRQRPVRCE